MKLLHATCVCIGSRGVLLLGESGSGKSDLALRLIDRGASLVADDQVQVSKKGTSLIASPPLKLRGLIEARGMGILKLSHKQNVKLVLAVELVSRAKTGRMPEPRFFDCLGVSLPLLSLHAFDDSTVAKIRLYFVIPSEAEGSLRSFDSPAARSG